VICETAPGAALLGLSIANTNTYEAVRKQLECLINTNMLVNYNKALTATIQQINKYDS